MTRHNSSFESTKTPPEVKKALAFVCFFSRIAEKAGVSHSHAMAVAKGKRTSKRVTDVIVREVRKIDRDMERAA